MGQSPMLRSRVQDTEPKMNTNRQMPTHKSVSPKLISAAIVNLTYIGITCDQSRRNLSSVQLCLLTYIGMA